LEQSGKIQDDSDKDMAELVKQILGFHAVPKARRDQDWLRNRRRVLTKLHSLWTQQNQLMDRLKESFAIAVRDILRKGVPGASEAVVLAEFTNEVLERLRAKEEEKAADASGSSQVGAMAGDERVGTFSAKEKYLAYFLEGSGRSPDEGVLGAWGPEPALTPQQLS